MWIDFYTAGMVAWLIDWLVDWCRSCLPQQAIFAVLQQASAKLLIQAIHNWSNTPTAPADWRLQHSQQHAACDFAAKGILLTTLAALFPSFVLSLGLNRGVNKH